MFFCISTPNYCAIFLKKYYALRVNAGRPANRVFVDEDLIVQHFERNPRNNTRRTSTRFENINHMTVWRVLRQNNFHPFLFQREQGLLEADFAPRLQFSQWILRKQEEHKLFADRILFTDEAFFCRDGVFNIHNSHNWVVNNPHVIYPHSHQHRFSVNVWAGIVGDNLIGPYLMPSPFTGAVYREFLQEVLPQLLENVPLNIRRRMWFQTAHQLIIFEVLVKYWMRCFRRDGSTGVVV